MVWHSYMLNPRAFAEDCLRMGKMDFWAQGMPWEAINFVINPHTLEYSPPAGAMQAFEGMTGRKWNNLDDSDTKRVTCPKCRALLDVPWCSPREKKSDGVQYELSTILEGGNGYAESDFKFTCKGCSNVLNHKYLELVKFKNDVEMLASQDIPMPGTFLSMRGLPERVKLTSGASNALFPNQLIKKFMLKEIVELGQHGNSGGNLSLDKVKELIEPAVKSANNARNDKFGGLLTIKVNGRPVKANLVSKGARISVRRMMSRYYGNASPFALDLVGAVIRQGQFV
jgi:hypothetical protein